jgi:hypothetical protein
MQYVRAMTKALARALVRHGSSRMRVIAWLAAGLAGMSCALTADGPAMAATSCHDGNGPAAHSSPGVAAKFERLYSGWHRESRRIQFSSNTHDYVALPSYRRMVNLGRGALPFLAKKLAQDRDGDFMLAYAVVEICGWDRRDLASDSAQAFRDKVLHRLGGE